MFGFDCDHDPIAPSGGALLEMLGLDTRSVREALAEDRGPVAARTARPRRTGARGGLGEDEREGAGESVLRSRRSTIVINEN